MCMGQHSFIRYIIHQTHVNKHLREAQPLEGRARPRLNDRRQRLRPGHAHLRPAQIEALELAWRGRRMEEEGGEVAAALLSDAQVVGQRERRQPWERARGQRAAEPGDALHSDVVAGEAEGMEGEGLLAGGEALESQRQLAEARVAALCLVR